MRLTGQGAQRSCTTAVLVLLAAAGGCRRGEVTHFRVPKEPVAAATDDTVASDLPQVPESGGLRWSLPEGWTQSSGGGGMRYATLKPPVEGQVDASVVVLPGSAGGELANVNRWRDQIGLPALDEPALASARRTLHTKAGEVKLYDFTHEGARRSRLVAGLASSGGNTWFVKLTGDADAVAAARPAFLHLLESLSFE